MSERGTRDVWGSGAGVGRFLGGGRPGGGWLRAWRRGWLGRRLWAGLCGGRRVWGIVLGVWARLGGCLCGFGGLGGFGKVVGWLVGFGKRVGRLVGLTGRVGFGWCLGSVVLVAFAGLGRLVGFGGALRCVRVRLVLVGLLGGRGILGSCQAGREVGGRELDRVAVEHVDHCLAARLLGGQLRHQLVGHVARRDQV